MKASFIEVYKECLLYLDKWTGHFNDLKVFRWMLLKSSPEWDDVSECIEYLIGKGVTINESALFDEISNLKTFM